MPLKVEVIHNPNATPESEREKYLRVMNVFKEHYEKKQKSVKKGE